MMTNLIKSFVSVRLLFCFDCFFFFFYLFFLIDGNTKSRLVPLKSFLVPKLRDIAFLKAKSTKIHYS